jgi:phytoene/squalene synthetase
VRIADEIVDSYHEKDAGTLLDELERDVYRALQLRYSANPIVHAFAQTAYEFGIEKSLVEPFFTSMRMDLTPQTYTKELYEIYIYGSAEVVGLMCLKVFCAGNDTLYKKLQSGARSLGAAYQKVNFLRDLASDSSELGRLYFPGYTLATFDEAAKRAVIADCRSDLQKATAVMNYLPKSAKRATELSSRYYTALLDELEKTPVDVIKQKRVRINNFRKTLLTVTPARKSAS